jgi:hypothetical protein
MKQTFLYALTACIGLTFTACHKTYTCKDVMGNTTGQVKALSKKKAEHRCAGSSNMPVTVEES